MEIYILRDGQEAGPFSEATAQSLLKEGAILVNDLAWKPGLVGWLPLPQVLGDRMESRPAATDGPPIPAAKPPGDPATAKQKAFLGYIGVPFSAETTKETAAILVNEAMEDPKLAARVARWSEDRLMLHPELFAAEIQARKDNRAQRFFELCQTEGADHFLEVTKAHCQVLVGYLDVRFPNWDAKDTDATWNYFFPAVAEKFPQLVRKPWRGKLRYPEGPKVSAELVQRAPVARSRPVGWPVGALVRGVVMGLGILLVLYLGQNLLVVENARTPATSPALTPIILNVTPGPVVAPKPAELAQIPIAVAPTTTTNPPVAPQPTGAENPSLFDSAPTPATTEAPMLPEPSTPAPKAMLVVTKATEVQLPFGFAKLPVGAQLKIIAQEGALVKALYQNTVVTLPVSATDLATPPDLQ